MGCFCRTTLAQVHPLSWQPPYSQPAKSLWRWDPTGLQGCKPQEQPHGARRARHIGTRHPKDGSCGADTGAKPLRFPPTAPGAALAPWEQSRHPGNPEGFGVGAPRPGAGAVQPRAARLERTGAFLGCPCSSSCVLGHTCASPPGEKGRVEGRERTRGAGG